MKIALIGYGKMGKAVERAAHEKGWTIAAKIHPSSSMFPQINSSSIKNADVCIDFTCPEAVLQNAALITALGKPLVIGTTGWDEKMDELRKLADQYGSGIVYGQNFGIGVNLFFKIAAYAGELIDRFEEYDFSIFEMHHREKKDSPSGTALFLANELLKKSSRKKEVHFPNSEIPIDPEKLQISSLRCGHSPGIHTLTLDSSFDSITLTHTSKNRDAFAKGALWAAEWIKGKQGIFHFREIL